MAERVWFITGASSGFGRELAEAAFERGDSVFATARKTDALAYAAEHERGEVIALDVTDAGQREAATSEAIDRFGRIDVLMNNAGRTRSGPSRRRPTTSFGRCSTSTSSVPPRSPGRSCPTCAARAAAQSSRCRAWAGR